MKGALHVKRILRGLVVLLLCAPAAGAEFEGVADMKISTTGGPTGEAVAGAGKIYVSRTGWRYEIEMSSPEMAHATGGQSFRMCMVGKVAEPDVVYSVNDAMKTYAVINSGYSIHGFFSEMATYDIGRVSLALGWLKHW